MIITPITFKDGSQVCIIKYNRVYWHLIGPAARHALPDGWRVYAQTESDSWPVTGQYARKWDAIAALVKLCNNPWTY
jgi:hypothetical protein